MDLTDALRRGLVLVGCGKMGSAMLQGWLAKGLPPSRVSILEPNPSDFLKGLVDEGLRLNAALPGEADVVIIAVKPQQMGAALPGLAALGRGSTLFLSIAAGTPIAAFEAVLGAGTPVVRAMPNTPAAIGRGITALVGNAAADAEKLALAEALLQAVGQTVRLEHEDQINAVTAISGSGPAYVFLMIEALAAAGEAQGLAPALSLALARATVAGAGALAEASPKPPAELRVDVTSPGGTTAAALAVLRDDSTGLPALINRAAAAAAARSRELAG